MELVFRYNLTKISAKNPDPSMGQKTPATCDKKEKTLCNQSPICRTHDLWHGLTG